MISSVNNISVVRDSLNMGFPTVKYATPLLAYSPLKANCITRGILFTWLGFIHKCRKHKFYTNK